MIELDGSFGEGGGALVRTALALSVLTGKEFKVTKIRAGRENPGLKAQHLEAIRAWKDICKAETNEIKLGSTELFFKPGKIKKGIYNIDIGTAGSISLLLQALIVPSLFASGKITLKIKGGTCGKWQASVDYLQNVVIPYLHRFVEKIELKINRRGYYPKGQGEIELGISPRFKQNDFPNFQAFYEELQLKFPKIKLVEQGKLEQIRGVINLSLELAEKEVGGRIKKAGEASLGSLKDDDGNKVPVNIRIEYSNTESIGGEIVLWAVFSSEKNSRTERKVDYDNPIIIGADALIEKGKSSEQIGKEAAEKLKQAINSGKPVEKHLADQLIPFMSLLPGSEMIVEEITDHAKTNIYVAEKFLPIGFRIEGNKISVEENLK